MKSYERIHIWDFPLTSTFVRVKDKLREKIMNKAITMAGGEAKLICLLNKIAIKKGRNKKYSRGSAYLWKRGFKIHKGKKITCNIPLWVLLEISKILTNSTKNNNEIMQTIEKNITYYCPRGGSIRIYNPKLPIEVTPQFVSLAFHFCGDGHIGIKAGTSSSYRQMNKTGLKRVYNKICDSFGNFKLSINEFNNGKLIIPKIITQIYVKYFNIKKNSWYNSRVPTPIKGLPKEFLVAGLSAFIVDEGNIGEVIEIYSKNYNLLVDIRDIALKCGYNCPQIRKKYRYGKFDSYRFLISSQSYAQFYNDVQELKKNFPFCDLAHKNDLLLGLKSQVSH